jgi:hypothetical protein
VANTTSNAAAAIKACRKFLKLCAFFIFLALT